MSKILIHYFSATGNTKRAVEQIGDVLKGKGMVVEERMIEDEKPGEIERFDFHLFAFPILSWDAPAFVKRYIRQLPDGHGAKAAVFAVYGGDPGGAVDRIARILNRKHYRVVCTGGAIYPSNWSQVMNPMIDEEAQKIIDQGDQKARDFGEKLCEESLNHPVSPRFGFDHPITGLIAILFHLLGSRFLGKAYIADSNCNRCGLCAKTCPVQTIKLSKHFRKRPFWGFRCEDCGRCINICPRQAIQVSLLKLILHFILYFWGVSVAIHLANWVGSLFPWLGQFPGWWLSLSLFIVSLILVQFIIVDRILFIIEQIPWLNRVFEWGYTHSFNRYTAPGFKPGRADCSKISENR
jgi:Pyruvate/2-oxoacid:ferredoxin oxidoreductase delta subunit/flavodoxin